MPLVVVPLASDLDLQSFKRHVWKHFSAEEEAEEDCDGDEAEEDEEVADTSPAPAPTPKPAAACAPAADTGAKDKKTGLLDALKKNAEKK